MIFQKELATYDEALIDLLGVNDINEGKYAVIKGDVIDGRFDSFADALNFGYEHYGLEPFLVKKIERHQTVHFFARSI